jgi:hypothetical protein
MSFGNIVRLPLVGTDHPTAIRACAKETIREGGRETRVGLCSRDVAPLCQVAAKVVSIFHAQKESRICGDKEKNNE